MISCCENSGCALICSNAGWSAKPATRNIHSKMGPCRTIIVLAKEITQTYVAIRRASNLPTRKKRKGARGKSRAPSLPQALDLTPLRRRNRQDLLVFGAVLILPQPGG